MKGWMGKILWVDLSKQEISERNPEPEFFKKYIGGRGIGIYYLNKFVDPKCDPLSPGNLLCLATGPLTGTNAPTGNRYMVMTKSPLSGALTASNSGGRFPTEMKKAGYDAIMFIGTSAEPVYLYLDNGRAELRPAKHVWGKTTDLTTDELLKETHPKAKVACIGPAGENKVLFAAIMNDRGRATGRSGVGAVMGSKRLKAVVVRGSKKIPLHDPEQFKKFNKSIMHDFKEYNKINPLLMRTYGTTKGIWTKNELGCLPTKNFQYGIFDKWEGGIHEEFHEKYVKGKKSCLSCPIGCTRMSKVEVPGYEGEGEGPEYETWFAMGSNCMIDNLAVVAKANYLCNELGMDTISMGCAVACAMELFEKGYLNEKDIGRPLEWGDGDALIELIKKTAFREKFGDILAEGSYRLAERYGHPELAIVSKKQDFAGYMPRVTQGMGLAYATSPIGASHMRGDPAYYEIFGIPVKVDGLVLDGKAQMVKTCQDTSCIIDSAGLCIFFAQRALLNQTVESEPAGIMTFLNAATGADYTMDELIEAGERIFNAERRFLVNAGFSRKDDTLPPRQTEEPMPDGPAKGSVCHLEEMLEEYYEIRGWSADGIPETEILKKLSLVPVQGV